MAKWEDYVITKVSFNQTGKIIEAAFVYDDYENHIDNGELRNRDWLILEIQKGKTFCTATKRIGGWDRTSLVTFQNNSIYLNQDLPKALPKRKVFISYYHHDDQTDKESFEKITTDLFTNKSVQNNDIDSDNSDEYIKQLIQKEYINDITVLIVLLGIKTKCRKHVDWEISAALNRKVGDRYAGLIGILLPTHPDYNTGSFYHSNLPARISENAKSGYTKIYNWTTDRIQIQNWVEDAFSRRTEDEKIVSNSIIQMKSNTCD